MATPVCESCRSHYEQEVLPELESEFEFEGEGEFEGEAGLEGESWLGAIGNVVGSLLGEQELEGEFEGEGEFEFEGESELESEISPIRKIYSDAMMEHLGELAAEAETEQEAAEHFLPLIGMAASKLLPIAAKALAPMARKVLSRIAPAVTRVTPQLTRGIGKIARGLHRNPNTRALLRAVPSVARRTVGSIAKQAARGRPVTPRTAVRTLARQTRRVIGNPRLRAQALRRHHRMDRRFHRRVGPRMVRPHWRYAGRPAAGGVVGAQVPGAPVTQATAGAAPVKQVRTVTQAGRPVQQVRYVGGRPGGYVCPPCPVCGASALTPAAARAPVPPCPTCGKPAVTSAAAPAAPVPRYGRVAAGQCVCPPCPACGAAMGEQEMANSGWQVWCREENAQIGPTYYSSDQAFKAYSAHNSATGHNSYMVPCTNC